MYLDVLINSIKVINGLACFFAFIVVLTQIAKKNKRRINYLIILTYISYGLIAIYYRLLILNKVSPFFFGFTHSLHLVFITSLYLCIKTIINPSLKSSKKDIFLFLPALMYLIAQFSILRVSHVIGWSNLITGTVELIDLLRMLLYIARIAIQLFFVVMSFYITVKALKEKSFENNRLLQITLAFLIGMFIGILVMAYSVVTENHELTLLNSLFYNILAFVPFISIIRYPQSINEKSITIRKENYQQTRLTGLNLDLIIENLIKLMKSDKIFTDPEINIDDVSYRLNITKHQLSEIMNMKLKINFKSFLNDYRLEEAKKQLINRPDDTIIDIAFNAGFNSKSSFNTIFKKNIGVTPREFRTKVIQSKEA